MVEVAAAELICSMGNNAAKIYAGLMQGHTGFVPVTRFGVGGPMPPAATINMVAQSDCSFLQSVLLRLREQISYLPLKTELFLATTVGEIDMLENEPSINYCTARSLLDKAVDIFGASRGHLVSAACSSSNVALGMAMQRIEEKLIDSAVVIGCDMVSEFVYSGFRSIGAMDEKPCRPYNYDRQGVSLGEAAGIMVLRSAAKNSSNSLGRISGYGISCDAAHITAPDSSGGILAKAIKQAVSGSIGAILGHGTGTVYNDQAELNALTQFFGSETTVPLVSIKANLGHTLGAAGIVQAVLGLEMLRMRKIPPQAGLTVPMTGAEKMVSVEPQTFSSGRILSLTLGFGGINSAIVLEDSL